MTPAEQTLIRKAQANTTYLWESDQATATRQWRRALFLGIGLAIILGLIAVPITGSLLIFWLVALLAFWPLSKLIFNQIRENISVADLLTGRTIRSNHLEPLILKENTLRQNASKYRDFLHEMRTTGEPKRISLEPE